MKTRILFGILAALLVLSLAACGGGATPTEAPEEPKEAPPAEEEKIELRLWMHRRVRSVHSDATDVHAGGH
jgi:predicted small lipoprotein YifL